MTDLRLVRVDRTLRQINAALFLLQDTCTTEDRLLAVAELKIAVKELVKLRDELTTP